MATYNWAYRPNVQNKYGIVIPQSNDDVRPSNVCYVALFGNDTTGNGSRKYPYRTFEKAKIVDASYFIIGSGWYNDSWGLRDGRSSNRTYIGDGNVIIDGIYIADYALGDSYNCSIYNLTFQNWSSVCSYAIAGATDCVFRNLVSLQDGNQGAGLNIFKNCLIYNCQNLYLISRGINGLRNITIDKCSNVRLLNIDGVIYNKSSIVISNSNIMFTISFANINYSLFYRCNFKFISGDIGPTTDAPQAVFYPSTPDGYVKVDSLQGLKDLQLTLYPSTPMNFDHCIFSDPKFNNPAIGDYSLAYDSPAKNASYEGTYIGAKSIANSIKVRADLAQGGFDWSTAVNLNIADDSITVIDPSQGGSVETTVIVNAMGREIAGLPVYGFNADRNGQYVDATADLAQGTLNSSGSLAQATPYLVQGGAITYNGNVYQPGETFTTTAITSFTTSTSGTVREILEAPQRHTVLARFGDGAPDTISSGTNLTLRYWYMVENSPVTYNARIYNVGEVFKSSDNSAFSGTGVVRLVMSTESYHYYEIGAKPYSNNEENIRTGAILRGNGDPAYVRGTINTDEFPINAKFIQLKYIVQVANLKP